MRQGARLVAAVALSALALAVAGCGAVTPTPVASSPEPSSPRRPSPGAVTRPESPSSLRVVEDPSLLQVLPAEVDGNPVALESLAFDEALGDETFATSVSSAAFGVVVSGDDIASAVVARPVEGTFGDGWFRDWRDSYDAGACAQAGGVVGNAESTLGGRTVHIGTCAGGLRTYHAWVEERGLLVSAFSVGEGRYGEQLMAGLRP